MRLCLNGATTMPYPLEVDLATESYHGFKGIELWSDKVISYLAEHSLDELVALVQQSSLAVAGIGPYFLNCLEGLPESREAARGDYQQGIATACAVGCETLLVCPQRPKDS